MAKSKKFPSRNEIIDFIQNSSSRIGKRDIARHFGIKGDNRTKLKHLLRDLINNGHVVYEHKQFKNPKHLPNVVICQVGPLNEDGDYELTPLSSEINERHKIQIILSDKEAKNLKPSDKAMFKIKKHGEENGVAIYAAKLVKQINEKKNDLILGIYIAPEDEMTQGLGYIEPVDKKDHNQYRVTEIKQGLSPKDGDLISFSKPKAQRRRQSGALVEEVFGSPKSEKAISLIALHAYDIPHIFPDDVVTEAQNCKEISNSAIARNNREDLCDIPFVTIDPHDAKDHDDALFAWPDEDPKNQDGFMIYVAIADVAEYVKPLSKMDKEAFKRGNSVYFPDQVVPMLPTNISNNLCSLKENEIRPSMVCMIKIDQNGKKLSHKFTRALIKSHKKLSYEQAQKCFDGFVDDGLEEIFTSCLRPLYKAYQALNIAKSKREPLNLDLPERKIHLDENGLIKSVSIPDRLDAHKLVEECMILANVAAAQSLDVKKQPLLYRVHEQPNLAKVEALNDFLKDQNLSVKQSDHLRPNMFNHILDKSANLPNKEMINISVLRSQMQAVYQTENVGHFGLNLQKYAHFTSPIRRYADLIVHRALIKALNLGDDGQTEQETQRLDDIAEHISTTERRAMKAERDTKDRLIAEFLSEKVGASFDARISSVIHAGIFIELDETGADGFIPMSSLDGYYIFDEALKQLKKRRGGMGYKMGDKIEVELKEANVNSGSLIFKMLTEPRKLQKSSASREDKKIFARKGRKNIEEKKPRRRKPKPPRKNRRK